MITDERINALKRFGYSDEEARFLTIAALQSGYFLRRQYLAWTGGPKGWKDVALLEKLAANEHLRTTSYRHNRRVYHLSAKPVYLDLGDPDNRNRREHQVSTILRRLIGLDYVLEHPQHQYLATEREKLDYFVGTLQIPPEQLPTRWYQSPRGYAATAKHFVDKFPLFLASASGQSGGPASAPVVHFCYVDEGAQDIDGFATYLDQYRSLFGRLSRFHVTYIAKHSGLFASAQRVFTRLSAGLSASPPALDPEKRHLLAYFEARKAYEARDFSGFDTARLIRFREQKNEFSAPRYDALYGEWKVHGQRALSAGLSTESGRNGIPSEHFGTYVVEHDYDLFGRIAHKGTVADDGGASQTDA